jgi:hypothetical protein
VTLNSSVAAVVNTSVVTCIVPPITGGLSVFVTITGTAVNTQPSQGLALAFDGAVVVAVQFVCR